jgi:hypothetical protein
VEAEQMPYATREECLKATRWPERITHSEWKIKQEAIKRNRKAAKKAKKKKRR